MPQEGVLLRVLQGLWGAAAYAAQVRGGGEGKPRCGEEERGGGDDGGEGKFLEARFGGGSFSVLQISNLSFFFSALLSCLNLN